MNFGNAAALGLALIVLGGATAAAQDFSQYEGLKNPRIATLPNQKMLVVEAKGDPAATSGEAFGLLFKAFFNLPGARMMGPPRARWLNTVTDPKENWVGLFAMPIPDSVIVPPSGVPNLRIEGWTYGEVAEILHVGPYGEETPTIENLMKFIAEKGYVIAGPHEEEYVKGPTQVSSPADYWTVIRYQVKKKEPARP